MMFIYVQERGRCTPLIHAIIFLYPKETYTYTYFNLLWSFTSHFNLDSSRVSLTILWHPSTRWRVDIFTPILDMWEWKRPLRWTLVEISVICYLFPTCFVIILQLWIFYESNDSSTLCVLSSHRRYNLL